MKHVVMFSGGIASWAVAKMVSDKYGSDNLYLVFCDVKGNSEDPHVGEDEDLYRFLNEASENTGGKLVVLKDGRDIWQVFKDMKYIGNGKIAPCSKELKQIPAMNWVKENCDVEDTFIYVGIDWSESHRIKAIENNYFPYRVRAPLINPPYLDKNQLIEWAKEQGLTPPRLYELGFSHNNCGGGCVRSGQSGFKHLLKMMPERYKVWEEKEQELQETLGINNTILNTMKNGEKKNLSLRELRLKIESDSNSVEDYDIGGCNCFFDYDEE